MVKTGKYVRCHDVQGRLSQELYGIRRIPAYQALRLKETFHKSIWFGQKFPVLIEKS